MSALLHSLHAAADPAGAAQADAADRALRLVPLSDEALAQTIREAVAGALRRAGEAGSHRGIAALLTVSAEHVERACVEWADELGEHALMALERSAAMWDSARSRFA